MSKLQRRKALAPVDHSPRMTWCNLETEIVNYFRSHGCEVLPETQATFIWCLTARTMKSLTKYR